MEEALWNLEDKWKLSTEQAFLLLTCSAVAVVGICAVVWIKSRTSQKKEVTIMNREMDEVVGKWRQEEGNCGWNSVKRVLVGSVRWSKAKKWEWEGERSSERWRRERPVPLLGAEDGEGFELGLGLGFQSHNSTSPVWQRPILMGEKCEMPKYSGLILYDERGRLLQDETYEEIACMGNSHQVLEKEGASIVVKTRLKDLL